ncbi:IclR family transcriptional regulator [Gordonia sp. DT30]|uniref:IclR family transcriptional regulator n=1 Tax=unclassified Gordonia (in: high G+C Gram-positive bacteria) TaxID=2657482 RepID=UPI003CEA353F
MSQRPVTVDSGFGGRQPKSVQNAFAILEAVASLGPGVAARTISRHVRIPAATTYRILNLLVADGYLVRTPDLSGFALGRRTAELAGAAVQSPQTSAGDVLEEMRGRTRHGLYLASFRDAALRIVDPDPDHEMVPVSTIARNRHAHAIGKLQLAYAPALADDAPLRSLTGRTLCDRHALREELHGIVVSELSFEDEESRIGRAALAVPIRGKGTHVVGGLVVQGLAGRVSPANHELVTFLRGGAMDLRGLI